MADEKNEFEGLSEEAPEQEFADEAPMQPNQSQETEMKPGDMGGMNFIKTPEVGESIILDVLKVVNSKTTTGKNKNSGETFTIGVKKKDGTVTRYDIETKDGRFTVMNWEIFYKLFGSEGVLKKYGDENNSYKGCKIKITKHYNAKYANMKDDEVSKLLDKTLEEAIAYKKEIADAMKNKTLYTVEAA